MRTGRPSSILPTKVVVVVLPAYVMFSAFGQADHHVAEVLCFSWVLFAFLEIDRFDPLVIQLCLITLEGSPLNGDVCIFEPWLAGGCD